MDKKVRAESHSELQPPSGKTESRISSKTGNITKKATKLLLVFLSALITFLVVLAAASFYYFVKSKPASLNLKPPFNATINKAPSLPSSYFTVPLQLDMQVMQEKLNAELPDKIKVQDRVEVSKVFGDIILNCDVFPRPVGLTGNNDFISIEIPVKFACHIKWARLKVATTRVRGDISLFVDANARITNEWKVVSDIRTSYKWHKDLTVTIFNQRVNAPDYISKPLTEELLEISKGVAQEFLEKELDLRAELAKFWDDIQTPIQVSDDPAAWIWLLPQSIFFPPWQTKDNVLSLQPAIKFRTLVSLGDKPETNKYDLPDLSTEDPPSNYFRLAVPLALDYEVVAATASKELKGTVIDIKDSLIYEDATINEIYFYPSGERVVVGVNVALRGSLPLFNVKGDFYVYADLDYDPEALNITVKDISYSRELDNVFWSYATWAVYAPLVKVLEQGVTMNLAKQQQDALAEVNQLLQLEFDDNIYISGKITSINFSDIYLLRQHLLLYAYVVGRLAVEYR